MLGSCHIRANEGFQKITIALFSQAPSFQPFSVLLGSPFPRQFLEAWGKAAMLNTRSTLSAACKGWETGAQCTKTGDHNLFAFACLERWSLCRLLFLSIAVSHVFVWSGKFEVGKGKYYVSKNILRMFYPIGKEHIMFRFLLTLLKYSWLKFSYTMKQLCT